MAIGGNYFGGQYFGQDYSAQPVNYTLSATHGSYMLSGENVDLLRKIVLSATPGNCVLTGIDIDFIVSRTLVAGVGVYAITGRSANLIYSHEVVTPPAGPKGPKDNELEMQRRKRILKDDDDVLTMLAQILKY